MNVKKEEFYMTSGKMRPSPKSKKAPSNITTLHTTEKVMYRDNTPVTAGMVKAMCT